MTTNIGPLFKKELLDLSRNRGALLPVVIVAFLLPETKGKVLSARV